MKALLFLAIGLAFLAGSASAAKAAPSGTLAIVEPAPYSLGKTIHFAWSAPGGPNPYIDVFCYGADLDNNGFPDLLYADIHSTKVTTAFLLGGVASEWTARGGPASCNATLFRPERGNNLPETLVIIYFNATG